MSHGLNATFQVLAATPNEAAVNVLLPALDAAEPAIRAAALRALLERPSPVGHREIIARAQRLEPAQRAVFGETPCRMHEALREAILGHNRPLCSNACEVALWSGEYELLPTLLALVESPQHPHANLARRAVLQLAERLSEELSAPRDYQKRRDPQVVRRHAVARLENAVHNYPRHGALEVIEAYLTLAQRDDAGLKAILLDSHEPSRKAVLEVLEQSRRPSVMRLLASFLEGPYPPLAALRLLAVRADVDFVHVLLKRAGDLPVGHVAENLRRLETIAWAAPPLSPLSKGGSPEDGVLAALDGEGQRRAVYVLLATGLGYTAKLRLLEYFVTQGKPEGRQAAVEALDRFQSEEAGELILRAVHDDHPRVQAAALLQLRRRGLPGAIPLLVERIHSPHEEVRQAVREALVEFRFERYAANFETLSEEVRRSTGQLVKQIDPETLPRLRAELASPSRSRRIRAIEIIAAMDAAADLDAEIVRRLEDDDHVVRVEAGRMLAGTPCERSQATDWQTSLA